MFSDLRCFVSRFFSLKGSKDSLLRSIYKGKQFFLLVVCAVIRVTVGFGTRFKSVQFRSDYINARAFLKLQEF